MNYDGKILWYRMVFVHGHVYGMKAVVQVA